MTDTQFGLTIGTALDRFIKRNQDDFPYATGELSQLLRDIALAGKIVNRVINMAGLVGIAGAYGTQNIQGEDQQKLDVVANTRFKRALKNGGEVCAVISEEEEQVIDLGNDKGRYIVAIDPLDGSSNIDVNVSIGTIFSIYRRISPVGSPVVNEDVMQQGNFRLRLAIYCTDLRRCLYLQPGMALLDLPMMLHWENTFYHTETLKSPGKAIYILSMREVPIALIMA